MQKMWRIKDVAGALDVDYSTILRWAQSGHLRTVKLPGGTIRIKDAEVQRIVTEQSTERESVRA